MSLDYRIEQFRNLREFHHKMRNSQRMGSVVAKIGYDGENPISVELDPKALMGIEVKTIEVKGAPCLGLIKITEHEAQPLIIPSMPAVGYAELNQELDDVDMCLELPFMLPIIQMPIPNPYFQARELIIAKLGTEDFFLLGYKPI